MINRYSHKEKVEAAGFFILISCLFLLFYDYSNLIGFSTDNGIGNYILIFIIRVIILMNLYYIYITRVGFRDSYILPDKKNTIYCEKEIRKLKIVQQRLQEKLEELQAIK